MSAASDGDGDGVELSADGLEATFHRRYSSGTAAVVGSRPLARDLLHYWEIKVLTELYGTDVMIGAGTERVDFAAGRYEFASFLGLDRESYGLSYTGAAQHGGAVARRCAGFGKGSVVGVYLDMWRGTLRYYVNRRPAGVSFAGLRRHRSLYPMVSSTASQSAVRLVYSMSAPASLSVLCARTLRPDELPLRLPGFRALFRAAFWILLPDEDPGEEASERHREAPFWKERSSRRPAQVSICFAAFRSVVTFAVVAERRSGARRAVGRGARAHRLGVLLHRPRAQGVREVPDAGGRRLRRQGVPRVRRVLSRRVTVIYVIVISTVIKCL